MSKGLWRKRRKEKQPPDRREELFHEKPGRKGGKSFSGKAFHIEFRKGFFYVFRKKGVEALSFHFDGIRGASQ